MKEKNRSGPHLDIEVGDLVLAVHGKFQGTYGIVIGILYRKPGIKHGSSWIPSLTYMLQDPGGSNNTIRALGTDLAIVRDPDTDLSKYKWK